MYDGKKVYGPYTRKDGRQIVILKTPGCVQDHQTISYPKYLVECYLQRYLDSDETVDHINGDFTDNTLSNLRVVKRSDHCRSHVAVRKTFVKNCVICGKEFTTTDNTRLTCGSNSCNGKCAHIDGFNSGNSFTRDKQIIEYESLRDTISNILPVNSNT